MIPSSSLQKFLGSWSVSSLTCSLMPKILMFVRRVYCSRWSDFASSSLFLAIKSAIFARLRFVLSFNCSWSKSRLFDRDLEILSMKHIYLLEPLQLLLPWPSRQLLPGPSAHSSPTDLALTRHLTRSYPWNLLLNLSSSFPILLSFSNDFYGWTSLPTRQKITLFPCTRKHGPLCRTPWQFFSLNWLFLISSNFRLKQSIYFVVLSMNQVKIITICFIRLRIFPALRRC